VPLPRSLPHTRRPPEVQVVRDFRRAPRRERGADSVTSAVRRACRSRAADQPAALHPALRRFASESSTRAWRRGSPDSATLAAPARSRRPDGFPAPSRTSRPDHHSWRATERSFVAAAIRRPPRGTAPTGSSAACATSGDRSAPKGHPPPAHCAVCDGAARPHAQAYGRVRRLTSSRARLLGRVLRRPGTSLAALVAAIADVRQRQARHLVPRVVVVTDACER
jgi:hypothetical protein